MKFQKLFSDAEGESHWQDIEVQLEERTFAPPAKAIEVSSPEAVKKTMFLRLKAGWDEPIHPTLLAQKLICLSGTVRAVTTTRAGDESFQANAMPAEIRIRPFFRPQPFHQKRYLYSRCNFKLNRSAALTKWRQLCSA